jgi:hypothetical protein
VGTGASLVHQCGSHSPILVSDIHVSFNFGKTGNGNLLSTFHVDTDASALTNFEAFFRSLGLFDKQVLDFLVIDLEHGSGDLEGLFFITICTDTSEHFLASLGDDALIYSIADHRVRLARPCLPIGKEACVITVPSIIEHILSELHKVRGKRDLQLRTRTSSHDTLDLRALGSRHRVLCTRHMTRNCSQK